MKAVKESERFILKKNLKKILNRLSQDVHLVAPVNSSGDVFFQEVKSAREIVFDYENCLNTPRDYTLLNNEWLFKYDLNKIKLKRHRYAGGEVVIFGSRACDTVSVGLLDKFFSREFNDDLYLRKRKNILIITLVCGKLGRNCFCTSTRSGPYLEDNFDIQLTDIGEGYFLEACSQKGRDFVKTFSRLMSSVGPGKKRKKKNMVKKAIKSKPPEFNLDKVYDRLATSDIKNKFWEDLSQRCQNCAGCLLICPSCSCFYVVDRKINDKAAGRIRNLDACYYEGFTRMAGGYNPSSPKPVMMQRKFYHKLKQQLDEFSLSGCTGCGRCNEICPGNINWLQSIKKIEKGRL